MTGDLNTTLGHRPIKKAAKSPPYKPSPHGEGGPRQRRSGSFVSTTNAPLFLLYFLLSFIPCLPYPLPKHRHPERSRGIFIALPPYVQMRPHSNNTLVLPFSPFPHPRFTGLLEGSLHFGRDDG